MIVLALRAQDVGADPGAQRLGHGNRAVGLLVLPDDRGQQAAGGQAGGVQGVDVGGGLALLGPVADVGAAGLVVPGPVSLDRERPWASSAKV